MGKIMRNGVQYGVDTADVLSTVAECDASASGGKGTTQVASAKALSELNSNFESSLGGLTFGVDTDGNYGYKKVGADTVTPFSNGFKWLVQNISVTGSYTFNFDKKMSQIIVLISYGTENGIASISIPGTQEKYEDKRNSGYWAWLYYVNNDVPAGSQFSISVNSGPGYNSGNAVVNIFGK